MYIETCGRKILVDMGLSFQRLTQRADDVGLDVNSITDCLVTHEHTDHIRGINVLSKTTLCTVYSSKETLESIGNIEKTIALLPNRSVFLGELKVTPISVSHDAINPLGFLLENEKIKTLVMTDTGKRPEDLDRYLDDLNMVVLEANHNVRMLQTGPYPYPLKQRVASKYGHLCNEESGAILADIVKRAEKKPHCFLAHLSEENNKPQIALLDVANTLKQQGILAGRDISLEIASQNNPTRVVSF